MSTEFLSQLNYNNGRVAYWRLILLDICRNRCRKVKESVVETEQPKPNTFTRMPLDGGMGSTSANRSMPV